LVLLSKADLCPSDFNQPRPEITIAITRGFAILFGPLQDAEWSAGKGKRP
jgi:hypothetical protein